MLLFGHHSAPQIGMLHMFQTCRCFVSCVFEFVVVRFIDCVSFSRRVNRVCLEKFSSLVVDVFFSWFGYMKMSLLDLFLFDEIL